MSHNYGPPPFTPFNAPFALSQLTSTTARGHALTEALNLTIAALEAVQNRLKQENYVALTSTSPDAFKVGMENLTALCALDIILPDFFPILTLLSDSKAYYGRNRHDRNRKHASKMRERRRHASAASPTWSQPDLDRAAQEYAATLPPLPSSATPPDDPRTLTQAEIDALNGFDELDSISLRSGFDNQI